MTPSAGAQPRAGRRRTRPWLVILAIVAGAGWVALSSTMRPIQQTCDPTLTAEICLGSIDAALRRGMPAIHPLLLAAHAAPGPAARPDQFGHRATITFGLLGPGQTTSVRLFFDAGGHWAGIADTTAVVLAPWAIGQGAFVAALVAAALFLMTRARDARGRRDPTLT